MAKSWIESGLGAIPGVIFMIHYITVSSYCCSSGIVSVGFVTSLKNFLPMPVPLLEHGVGK